MASVALAASTCASLGIEGGEQQDALPSAEEVEARLAESIEADEKRARDSLERLHELLPYDPTAPVEWSLNWMNSPAPATAVELELLRLSTYLTHECVDSGYVSYCRVPS